MRAMLQYDRPGDSHRHRLEQQHHERDSLSPPGLDHVLRAQSGLRTPAPWTHEGRTMPQSQASPVHSGTIVATRVAASRREYDHVPTHPRRRCVLHHVGSVFRGY
jgi:hypothetical protein